jgi:hypothetical protein
LEWHREGSNLEPRGLSARARLASLALRHHHPQLREPAPAQLVEGPSAAWHRVERPAAGTRKAKASDPGSPAAYSVRDTR